MRFYEVDSGSIKIDGVDIRDMSKKNLRALFQMVLQDTWLFSGTVRDNVAYGKENATQEEIEEACKRAHVDSFIRSLPDGYDTIINEETTNISGGQKQLLTIARAFLADRKLLILDEATSSVDTRTPDLNPSRNNLLLVNLPNFLPFRPQGCSTDKNGSKREKLSLKIYIEKESKLIDFNLGSLFIFRNNYFVLYVCNNLFLAR